MRRIYILILVFCLCTAAQANFLGIKKASETVVFPVQPPLDSAGIPGTADSIQVITYADNDATRAYGATGTGYSCAGIDTTKDYGGTLIWFSDRIQDIDGDGGNVELAVQIVAWVDGLPTHTFATMQVVSDSLENFLDAAMDSSSSAAALSKDCLDSLQNQDDWVGNVRYNCADSILRLRGLHVRGTNAGDTGLIAIGHTDGSGAYFSGGAGNAHGLYARGFGTGNGFLIQADSTGHGIRAQGGQTSGDGILAEARGSASSSYGIRGNGQAAGAGIYGYGGPSGNGIQGVSGGAGHGAYFRGGSSGGHGFLAEAQAGDSCGIAARGHGSGGDFAVTIDLDDLTGTLDASEIGTGAIGGDEMAASAAAEMAVGVWGYLLDTAWTAGSFGDSAKGWGATSASGLDSGVVQRIANRRLDSTQTADVISGTIDSIGGGGVDAIWNETQADHGQAGTFGFYLDAPISGIEAPSGSGSYPVTLAVIDSVNAQVVPGAKLSVYNLGLDALLAIGATGSEGTAVFNLDSGGYVVSTFAPGYIFSTYDTITVSGTTSDSIAGYRFDPGSPPVGDLCRVYGFIYGIDGRPVEGVRVDAQITDGVVRHNSTIISPYRKSVVTDSTGYFYLDLIPSDKLAPPQTEYLITATYPAGTILKKKIQVPAGDNWLLAW